jgi:hypothetical protein
MAESHDHVVGVTTMLWAGQPKNHGLIPGMGETFFSSAKGLDWLWAYPTSYSVRAESP